MRCYRNIESLKIVADNCGSLQSKIVEAFRHLWGHNDACSEPNHDHDKCMRMCKDYWEDHGLNCHNFIW